MSKFKVIVEVEVDGDAAEMQGHLVGYLTGGGDEGFFQDYGYGAWGGYDGPFVTSVTVTGESGAAIASHTNRDKPKEDDE